MSDLVMRRSAALSGAAHAVISGRRRLAWILGGAGITLAFTVRPFWDPDVWWHLALGRLILARGIPSTEPFSFVHAAHAWVGQQWLYEVLLARMVSAGGAGLAMLVMGVAGSLAFALAAWAVPRRDRIPAWTLGVAVVLSALVAAQVMGPRGQVVTVLGTAVVVLVLARWREGSTRAVWVLPPLLLLWANLHAGFVTGLVLPLVAAGVVVAMRLWNGQAEPAARLRPLLLATGVAALATLVNPAGPGLYGYVAQTFANPTLTQDIVEWSSPDFHNLFLRLFEVEAVLLVCLWAASRRPDPLDVTLALGTIAATLQAQRNVALFAVVATPQLARYATLAWREGAAWRHQLAGRLTAVPAPVPGRRALTRALLDAARRRSPAWFALGVAVLVTGATLVVDVLPAVSATATARYEATHEPRAAADFVATHLAGQRLYSTYEWGGYLAARFPTGRVVYLYGESAVFGSALLDQYLAVHFVGTGWQDILAQDGMRHAVLPDTSPEVAALLEAGWRVMCHDGSGGAVVMRAPGAGELPLAATPPPPPSAAPACSG